MTELPPSTNSDKQLRDTGEHVVFWMLWVIFLLPALWLGLLALGGGFGFMLIPLLIQISILVVSLIWFLGAKQPFSKVMWLLVGGSVLLYFILFGSCVVMIFNA